MRFSGSFETLDEEYNEEEENELDLIDVYFRDAARLPLLTAEEERSLARLARSGDSTAKDKLASHNLRLVISIAKQFHRSNTLLSFLDLIQEGNLGLLRALEKFDPERGFRLSTYATYWIRQALIRAVDQLGSSFLRTPVHVGEQLRKLKRLSLEENDVQAIAEILAQTEEQVMNFLRILQPPLSLDASVNENPVLAEALSLEASQEQSSGELLEEEMFITDLLQCLPERQRRIIILRFGLYDGVEYSLLDIGKELGISRERVRQLEVLALHTLRQIAPG